ncbi:sigma-54 interaction domain-containing protein [Sporomusa acidovorans]|uniref:Anaerobic nitric oxide reductase transcription regulator NorR n=1 Tax=Sporomusa acidovorans (strain ATCC 49682 / DSM 3132 / Mol) TaxID=1123286 RepID=A0ABZ3J702_SPOA4|nr:sigma 54-interacting transcriptional regulator [Sporomusa acidovorans]OZC18498.1 transcriptional regulatory protein ZraR [Sporomusa acidovorans DSM 3132]SDE36684.1 Transcriptional regulator containing PAS, AAA-type ATPase, and DNA-binding Fis domains [Sporomusa acidovorans]
MMKKRVAIVTYYSSIVGEFYRQQLNFLFDNMLQIDTYSFANDSLREIEADLILVSHYDMYLECKKYIKNNSDIVMISITILKEALERIKKIPRGSKVMLVNISADRARETIALLYQAGIDHIELTPVYPGIKDPPVLDIAITPDEERFVPRNVKEVINIGNRVLDMNTVVDIAVKMDMGHLLLKDTIQEYFNQIVPVSYGIKNLLGATSRLTDQLDMLQQIVDDGLIGVYPDGIVYLCNEAAEKILGYKRNQVVGSYLYELTQQALFQEVIENWQPIKNRLVKINGVDIVVSALPYSNVEERLGVIVMLKKYADTEKQQHRIRIQAVGKGHVAKYSFEHIVGESKVTKNLKELAQRMAQSSSSVLITGESGTGKELLAQAIHNASPRSKYPFIAVNCAALPENLLESELFGYEEGAFTGAKKGGKMGYFEMAHLGTLFLDEIGDMAPQLQVRLLRTIQEKEIVRIAGDVVIKVDVRIISATNCDLKRKVRDGEFRKDLYYRLNVLPLSTPSLRERIDDIPLLFRHISRNLNFNFTLTPEAMEVFQNHDWEGNIRELHNYVEYLGQLNKDIIGADDVLAILQSSNSVSSTIGIDNRELNEELERAAEKNKSGYFFVLTELERCYLNRNRTGRRSIAQAACKQGVFLSEQEIRTILIVLEECGIIDILKGRGGTRLTEQGLKLIPYLKKKLNGV